MIFLLSLEELMFAKNHLKTIYEKSKTHNAT